LHANLSPAWQCPERAGVAGASIIEQGKLAEPANTDPPASSLLKSFAASLAADGPQTGLSQLMPFGTMVNVSNTEIADLPGEESSNIR